MSIVPESFERFSAEPGADPSRPMSLEGGSVRLERLREDHAPGLLEAGRDESIWTYVNFPPFRGLADAERFVAGALKEAAAGSRIPFAIVRLASGKVAGTTSYLEINPANRGIEIGWTWIAPRHQRTALNTQCKYMLMRRAFEEMRAGRLQFKTDARNQRSRNAIERLGAKPEGVLRNHVLLWTGGWRDSAYFSVLDNEWPAVKAGLEDKLLRGSFR